MPPRSALSLLGQIAAPLQVLWIQSHILAQLQQHEWGWTGIDPSMCLKVLQQHLVVHSFRKWITPMMYQPRCLTLHLEDEDIYSEVIISKPLTVRDLAAAEKSLCGWGHYAIVKHNGERLALDSLLHTDIIYTITLRKSAQVRTFAADHITGRGTASSQGLGDKIIWHYMKAFADHHAILHEDRKPWIFYPFRMHQFMQQSLPDTICQSWQHGYQLSNGSIFVIFESMGHWLLLVGHPQQSKEISWTLHDGLRQDQQLLLAAALAIKICHTLDLVFRGIHMGNGLLQAHPNTCGTIALVQMALDLCQTCVDLDFDPLVLHSWLLVQQPQSGIYAHGSSSQAELQTKLATLLQYHGVPADAVTERVRLLFQKIGPELLQEAFEAKNSWAYLKALASRPSISLRLVQPDELSRHVTQTAKNKFGANVDSAKHKKKKHEGRSSMPVLNPDPELLVLTRANFQDTDDDIVEQIQFSEVEAEATGIAICTLAQGRHFLQAKQSISTKPLALLLTERPPKAYMDEHDISEVSFAAKYTGTGEPVLIFGAFKNLGDIQITQHIPGALDQPALICTQVVKVQIFRDEYQGAWSQLTQSPVRALCQAVPRLQFCPGKECGADCPKSHAAVDEDLDSILMEIWSRTFTKLEGGKVPALDAQVFGVFIRVPASILDVLLQCGAVGIYFEPRSDKNKGHDERYRVIWLPARTHDEAMHTCRTTVHALGLVRMKKKYGLRVLAEHEEQTFKQLKPDATWVNTQVQRIFQLFPLPHGLQRGGVIKLLQDIDWAVKPLQPGKGSADAMSWQVGAAVPPPQDVITGFGREIIITEITRESKPAPAPKMIASVKTQQHLRSEASSTAATSSSAPQLDPWTLPGKDPWKPAAVKPTGSGKSHLQEVTGSLKDELTAAMQQKFEEMQLSHSHPASGNEGHQAENKERFAKIETSIGELQAQQLQFSGWFTNIGQQMKAAETSIQGIQYTLSTHQADLQGLHHEIKGVSEQVGQAVQSALHNHKTEVSHELESRFDRLEALFSNKKQRCE